MPRATTYSNCQYQTVLANMDIMKSVLLSLTLNKNTINHHNDITVWIG